MLNVACLWNHRPYISEGAPRATSWVDFAAAAAAAIVPAAAAAAAAAAATVAIVYIDDYNASIRVGVGGRMRRFLCMNYSESFSQHSTQLQPFGKVNSK